MIYPFESAVLLEMQNVQVLHETDLEIFNWTKPYTVVVMYLRQHFNDKKIKLVYSNEPNQMNLSCPVNDGSNRTA